MTELSDEFAERRGRRYPAHAWIAERFPEYVETMLQLGAHPEEIAEALMVGVNPAGARVLTYGVTCMLEAIAELEAEGWTAPD